MNAYKVTITATITSEHGTNKVFEYMRKQMHKIFGMFASNMGLHVEWVQVVEFIEKED